MGGSDGAVLTGSETSHAISFSHAYKAPDGADGGRGQTRGGFVFDGLGMLFAEEGSLWQSKIMCAAGHPADLVRCSGTCRRLKIGLEKDEDTWKVRCME